MKLRIWKHLCILCITAFAAQAQQEIELYQGREVASRQVLVKLRVNSTAVRQQIQQLAGADIVRALSGSLGIVAIHSRGIDVAGLIATLRNSPLVAYVEPDYIVRASATPNDPYFPQQWSLLNTATPGADIGATSAWNISSGGSANVVGVVDTGIDYTHPDLVANVWSAPSAFTIDLGWGSLTCPAGSHGYNAVARTCDPRDDNQHGTHVSGTIGATGNNAAGVAGVNWNTQIMALKFLDSSGTGSVSAAIESIEFCIQAKATFAGSANPVNVRVLSNSWGGTGFSQALLDEINKANTNEMLFVVAAGNSAQNVDTKPSYPAAFTAPNVISVAATTSTDALASFSNYGRTSIHLGAPGVGIISTVPGGSYAYLSGTSMATPHVSGAAMLILSKCGLNTSQLKSAILGNTDAVASLASVTVTGGRLNVNKAIRSCASQQTGTAAFIKTDSTTAGSWKSQYGAEGYTVVNDGVKAPAYVTVSPTGNSTYTWSQSTTDPRGLQKTSGPDRIAATWYSGTSFYIDLNFTDQAVHQVAVYCVDWDAYGPRAQTVSVLDANDAVIDTRSVTSFTGGRYLVWNLSGHVKIRATSNFTNAVISGIFFGPGAAPAASATYVATDTATQGQWKSKYGGEGYTVINDSAVNPSYVTPVPAGQSTYVWSSSTADPRALQKASASDGIAATWYSDSNYVIDLNFADQATHQVALYCVDWDSYGPRTQTVQVLDTNGNILDSRSLSGFSGGQYLVWNLAGHVQIKLTAVTGNAVMSGIFFGPASTAATKATFITTDTVTQGTWKSKYGADGYLIPGDASVYPGFVSPALLGQSFYLWTASTTDPRAVQKANASDRIAATWYSDTNFLLDLNFTDQVSHQVAVYCMDWDNFGPRIQRVDVLDTNNTVLDTRAVSSFSGGQYLVWNFTGHVKIRFTTVNGNAVISGVFFR